MQLANDGHTLYVNNLYEKCSQDGELSRLPCLTQRAAFAHSPVPLAPLPAYLSCGAHVALYLLGADLKKAMRCIFGQFGNILDVVSRRTYRLRGQVSLSGRHAAGGMVQHAVRPIVVAMQLLQCVGLSAWRCLVSPTNASLCLAPPAGVGGV